MGEAFPSDLGHAHGHLGTTSPQGGDEGPDLVRLALKPDRQQNGPPM
jgi:hypothetical protein